MDNNSLTPSPEGDFHALVQCPTCKKMAVYSPKNSWRPFCSERCKMIDLGAWSTEEYRMQAKPTGLEDDLD